MSRGVAVAARRPPALSPATLPLSRLAGAAARFAAGGACWGHV